jgi:hypothetical protein
LKHNNTVNMSMMDIDNFFGWPSQQRGHYGRPRNSYMFPGGAFLPESYYEQPRYTRGHNYNRRDYMDADQYEILRERQRMMHAEKEKRHKEEAMRHRAKIEQQREQEREQALQEAARRMHLDKNARRIQRWFRSSAESRRQDIAARKIQSFFTSLLLIEKAQQQLRVLRGKKALDHIREQADALKAEYRQACLTGPINDDKGRVRRDILAYEEYLTKLMLEIDNIPTHGDVELRSIRKATVTYIQQLLRELDSHRSGTLKTSRALKRGGPKYMPPASSGSDSDAMEQ